MLEWSACTAASTAANNMHGISKGFCPMRHAACRCAAVLCGGDHRPRLADRRSKVVSPRHPSRLPRPQLSLWGCAPPPWAQSPPLPTFTSCPRCPTSTASPWTSRSSRARRAEAGWGGGAGVEAGGRWRHVLTYTSQLSLSSCPTGGAHLQHGQQVSARGAVRATVDWPCRRRRCRPAAHQPHTAQSPAVDAACR